MHFCTADSLIRGGYIVLLYFGIPGVCKSSIQFVEVVCWFNGLLTFFPSSLHDSYSSLCALRPVCTAPYLNESAPRPNNELHARDLVVDELDYSVLEKRQRKCFEHRFTSDIKLYCTYESPSLGRCQILPQRLKLCIYGSAPS